MDQAVVIDLMREAIQATLLISAPALGVALVVGLVIALFQALTQIQEMTLTFVPKIIAMAIAILFSLPFMMAKMEIFSITIFDKIATG